MIMGKISVANLNRSEWATTYLCENPIRSYPKESVPDLSVFIFILNLIIVLELYIQTMLNGVSSDLSGY